MAVTLFQKLVVVRIITGAITPLLFKLCAMPSYLLVAGHSEREPGFDQCCCRSAA